ncbi:sugar phosphate nucleotidyltransferase [Paenibacillus sp. YN15]|uniref:sugar phosphate nucleotidyltransferase n=1 Tax=Paenibacillus sp. YN15 TaxID=1742774 RepID=UPI000DCBDD1B|nr:sugar phosphate nucleotidyltransferase [Paenibacillus sp. YN15]RAU93223.1 mannose-1-phosphate guanylyltransferase [Paenibacillus sp. YN15]
MKLVLLSGGSGKRLWPLSNDSRSKQFLKVLPAPDGQRESMVQRVWRQIGEVGLASHACIVTGNAQAEIIHSQIGEQVPLIIEPARRDTFAAIVLAASYVSSVVKADPDETIVVMPVDPYVDVEFFATIQKLGEVLKSTGSSLALIGAAPTHPSEKYGYILTEESTGEVRTVKRFAEKPKEALARTFMEQGALWNCGIFAGKLSFFMELLRHRGLPAEFASLRERYGEIPKNSFDYEVVEHLRDISVIPYTGYWKDLGTWNTLTEEMTEPISGKGVCSHDSANTHIVNELDIPVAVLGVSNLIVAASPDGILIADKEESPRIKEILGDDHPRPMYVERYWGWYRVLEYGLNDRGDEVLVRRVCILAGKSLSYQMHKQREEVWTITAGHGEVILESRRRAVHIGDVIRIPQGVKHSILAHHELQMIETQIGSSITEADIYRFDSPWSIDD